MSQNSFSSYSALYMSQNLTLLRYNSLQIGNLWKKIDLCEIKPPVLTCIKTYYFSVSWIISWWTCISAIPFNHFTASIIFQPSQGRKQSLASTCSHWQSALNSQAYYNINKDTEVITFRYWCDIVWMTYSVI